MSKFGHSAGGGRRAAPRRAAPLIALVSTLTETKTAHLIDVSSSGARIRGADLPGHGKDVLVSVEGLKAFGSIVWSEGDERGVTFQPNLQPGEVQRLALEVAQAKGLAPDMKAALDDWTFGAAR